LNQKVIPLCRAPFKVWEEGWHGWQNIAAHDGLAKREEGLMIQNRWLIAKEGIPILIPAALLTIFLG